MHHNKPLVFLVTVLEWSLYLAREIESWLVRLGFSDMRLLFITRDIHLWQATKLHYLADTCIVLKMSSLWDSHKAAVLWKFHFLPPTLPLLISARYWKWGNKFNSKFYMNIVLGYLWGSIKSFPVWNHGWESVILAVSVGQVLYT